MIPLLFIGGALAVYLFSGSEDKKENEENDIIAEDNTNEATNAGNTANNNSGEFTEL